MNLSCKTLSILVVDDSSVIRMIVKKTLESERSLNVKVIEASDGQDGFKMLIKHHPDLVVTDYNMPGMSGLELISKIRKMNPVKPIPIILLTGEEDEEMIKLLYNNFDFKYLKKPFVKKDLIEKVLTVLN